MKKKVLSLLGASLLVCTMIFTGCGSKEATDAAATQEAAQDMDMVADTYKVSFMDADGTTELSVEEVKSGECATAYTPEKENMVFMGWFATPSMTHEFDFSQPITADTQVFAGFVENVEDTRTFAIVGNGVSPLLSASSWGSVINEEHYLTKAADKNEYTITCDLAEGMNFSLQQIPAGAIREAAVILSIPHRMVQSILVFPVDFRMIPRSQILSVL